MTGGSLDPNAIPRRHGFDAPALWQELGSQVTRPSALTLRNRHEQSHRHRADLDTPSSVSNAGVNAKSSDRCSPFRRSTAYPRRAALQHGGLLSGSGRSIARSCQPPWSFRRADPLRARLSLATSPPPPRRRPPPRRSPTAGRCCPRRTPRFEMSDGRQNPFMSSFMSSLPLIPDFFVPMLRSEPTGLGAGE